MNLTARDKILTGIKNGKPPFQSLPSLPVADMVEYADATEKFIEVFSGIGGQVVRVNGMRDIQEFIAGNFNQKNVITTISSLNSIDQVVPGTDGHKLENIDLAILPAEFGVAENGAVWLTEEAMQIRVLPFICQQLAIVLSGKNILSNMQQAYDKVGKQDYGFAAFIAGPSKTADIEQSLVLGAHGPKDMIIFLVD